MAIQAMFSPYLATFETSIVAILDAPPPNPAIPLPGKALRVFSRVRPGSGPTFVLQFGDTPCGRYQFLLPPKVIFDKLVTKVAKQS
jgi:hypothetical protein